MVVLGLVEAVRRWRADVRARVMLVWVGGLPAAAVRRGQQAVPLPDAADAGADGAGGVGAGRGVRVGGRGGRSHRVRRRGAVDHAADGDRRFSGGRAAARRRRGTSWGGRGRGTSCWRWGCWCWSSGSRCCGRPMAGRSGRRRSRGGARWRWCYCSASGGRPCGRTTPGPSPARSAAACRRAPTATSGPTSACRSASTCGPRSPAPTNPAQLMSLVREHGVRGVIAQTKSGREAPRPADAAGRVRPLSQRRVRCRGRSRCSSSIPLIDGGRSDGARKGVGSQGVGCRG